MENKYKRTHDAPAGLGDPDCEKCRLIHKDEYYFRACQAVTSFAEIILSSLRNGRQPMGFYFEIYKIYSNALKCEPAKTRQIPR
jgi:hypothetical protein